VRAHLPAYLTSEVAVDDNEVGLEMVHDRRAVVFTIRDLKIERCFVGMNQEIARHELVVRDYQDVSSLAVHFLEVSTILAALTAKELGVVCVRGQFRHFITAQGAQLVHGTIQAFIPSLSVAVVFPAVSMARLFKGLIAVRRGMAGNNRKPFQIAPINSMMPSRGTSSRQVTGLNPLEHRIARHCTERRRLTRR